MYSPLPASCASKIARNSAGSVKSPPTCRSDSKNAEAASKAGHGGGDYFEILDFVDSVRGLRPSPVGIHEAMDMTLPGLVSRESIEQGSVWLEVPDSREW